ncbi:hypothetical protein [Aquiflexum lacus]
MKIEVAKENSCDPKFVAEIEESREQYKKVNS